MKDKLDRMVKKSRIFMYIVFALGTIVSIVGGFVIWKKMFGTTKKIESIADCPDEIYTPDDDEDDEPVEEL